ncbi:MAG: 1-acyl-sn-glycerol-3-phosphate acyltransferase [Proteobacteria bacterium]|nr:MAG: 1-acyl-sn-glycerol-3-phosphate acyltransferase [Pseudomonadota bacterium]
MKHWNYDNEQWTKLPTYLKHLPLFTRHVDLFSASMRLVWSFLLKDIAFGLYIRLKVTGTPFSELRRTHPKLLIISNHASHLDATSIAAAIPRIYWLDLYIAAAKDYFFSNALFTFFSKHCLGAIPIDRKDRRGEAINLIIKLLNDLPRIWLIIFPEGTRSKDGKIQDFKRGISIFAERTKTPILFVYIEGNAKLWPKGKNFPRPGTMNIHVGPVHPPGDIKTVYAAYKAWVVTINPLAFHDEDQNESTERTTSSTEDFDESTDPESET